jgi:hypothetical protein
MGPFPNHVDCCALNGKHMSPISFKDISFFVSVVRSTSNHIQHNNTHIKVHDNYCVG